MKYLYVLLLTLTVNACSGQRNQKTEESNVAPPTFEMVSVPTLIPGGKGRIFSETLLG